MMKEGDGALVSVGMGKTNCFVIFGSRGAVVLDPGHKGKISRIEGALRAKGMGFRDIKLIILTHTHFDHTRGVSELKEATGAKLVVHRVEADMIKNGFTPVPKGTNPLFRFISSLGRKGIGGIGKYDPAKPDIIVSRALDLKRYGFSAKIIHTPGHTAGSISIILNDGRALVGDTLFNILPGSIYPPFADDEEELMRSWDRLEREGVRRFYPAHGKPFDRARFLETFEKVRSKRTER